MPALSTYPADSVRSRLPWAQRIVVKVGTRSLVDSAGRPQPQRLKQLVWQLAEAHGCGKDVVLVTSGAIGAGMQALGLKKRPTELPELQMAAAVGQSRLMQMYAELFAKKGIVVGQVLLTYDDLQNRGRHLNAQRTISKLLEHRVVPIINENDVVSSDEIKFGDNDVLASLVTTLVRADLLVLLSTTDGLRKPLPSGKSVRISEISAVTETELSLAFGKGSALSTGGMESKLRAAQVAVRSGACVVIADGRKSDSVTRVLNGQDTGTAIGGKQQTESIAPGRKRWIAFFNRVQGSVIVDDGARKALEQSGRSLLPIGVTAVDGAFLRGSLVNVVGTDGTLIGRGLTGFSHEELKRVRGKKSGEVASLLGATKNPEVIHRDNFVLLRSLRGEIV